MFKLNKIKIKIKIKIKMNIKTLFISIQEVLQCFPIFLHCVCDHSV